MGKTIRKIVETSTVKQLILALCYSYSMPFKECCFLADCAHSYYYKMIKDENFHRLVKLFFELPPDPDNVESNMRKRIFADLGRLFYNIDEILGEK